MFGRGKKDAINNALDNVSHLHNPVRKIQNDIVSRALHTNINLSPAEIKSGSLQYFLRGSYLIFHLCETNTIVIPKSCIDDFSKEKQQYSKLTLDDYILNEVARFEGVRTANHCIAEYGITYVDMMDEEYTVMGCAGDFLRKVSIEKLNRFALPLKSDNIILKEEDLAYCLVNPYPVYSKWCRAKTTSINKKV